MITETDEALTDVVAYHRIRRCIVALARGEDRRDADIIRGCFWPEAELDFGIFAGSFDDYLAWVVPGSPAVLLTLHTLGQSLIESEAGTAVAETHVASYHRIDYGSVERDVTLGGRYLDRLEERDGVWRIIQRMMVYDWSQDMGPSADFSSGVFGTPFLRGRPVGRTSGDVSEIFFG